MSTVIVQCAYLADTAKKRMTDRILFALQAEGIKIEDAVVHFEHGSVYQDGQLSNVHEPIETTPEPEPVDNSWKTRTRRTAAELRDLKANLRDLLRRDKVVSSFQIQDKLGLKDCDWAPATLRRILKELVDASEITVTGQKRGTKYHWVVSEPKAGVKLEKGE